METYWLILALGAVTYFTRFAGHLIISQFGVLHPRVRAALDAVPAAVITTLVVPSVIDGGLNERLAFAVAVLAAFRFSVLPTLFIGLATLAILRLVLPA